MGYIAPSRRNVLFKERTIGGRGSASRIVSRGDRIASGTYRLHSAFPSVLNYLRGSALVSVVRPEVGAGPDNIMVSGPFPAPAPVLRVTSRGIVLDRVRLAWASAPVYRSRLEPVRGAGPRLERNMRALSLVRRLAARGSAACALVAAGAAPGRSSFERECGRRFALARRELLRGRFASAARSIKGIGPGLTPAGDDALCGVLAALAVKELVYGLRARRRAEDLYRNAVGGNPLSNAFLDRARKGLFGERQKLFIEALLSSSARLAQARLGAVLRVGATSGGDWLAGFALGVLFQRGVPL